ncbi:protein disulfide oxidoreductase [Thiomicrorhabdus sp. zzn3]|uniref:protein disulfide oxidoreductase n=1 Tax=Thiomicrorhabdus sp. zzn3 TaxID=3039775 RepID=UPI00243745D2|nr:protein disulfide oxidoreductase [Thiomicrorhabdus sp. zzn3]MDG6777260.1 protein disulfide oxidoreductase [Thiomicrorhabdus sp. zzn3]
MSSHHDSQPDQTQQASPRFWQRNWVKNTLTVLIFIGAYLALRPFMQGDVIQGQVPDISVQTLQGETLSLRELEQPALIHIWATWCPICGVTRGSVESVAEDYTVINIATQSGDDDQLLHYAQQHEMNPAIIVNDLDGELMKQFGAKAVPADFILGANGQIEFVEVGFTSELGLRLRLWWAGLQP